MATVSIAEARFDLAIEKSFKLDARVTGEVRMKENTVQRGFGLMRGPLGELWLSQPSPQDGITRVFDFCPSGAFSLTTDQLRCAAADSRQKGVGLFATGSTSETEREETRQGVVGYCSRCWGYDYRYQCWLESTDRKIAIDRVKVRDSVFDADSLTLVDAAGRRLAVSQSGGVAQWVTSRILESRRISSYIEYGYLSCSRFGSECRSFCFGDYGPAESK